MVAAVNVVVADAQGTPVNHTFIPLGTDRNGVFWMEDQSQAAPIGYWRVSIERKAPASNPNGGTSSKDRTYRYRISLHQPILENVTNSTISGIAPAATLAYVPRSIGEFIIPERSALLDRQNMAKMYPLLLQNSQIKTMIETLGYLS